MDDIGEEMEFEEHSNDSVVVESRKSSSLSWVWRRGLWLGKKVVVTGVVISSAPLLLPPLVVAMFLGFAVSVPAGVVIVCYTCTQKLMNRLLPCPVTDTDTPASTMLLEDEDQGAVVEKEEGDLTSDVYFNGIEDIDEPEQGEVAMDEQDQEVVSSGIGKEEQEDGNVEKVALAGIDQEVVSSGIEEQEHDGSVEKVAMVENEDEVDSSVMYVDNKKNVEELEQKEEQEVINRIKDSEVELARIVDRESYVQGGNECDVVKNTGSSHPDTEGLGRVDKKELSNEEIVLPLEEATELVAVKEQEEVAIVEDKEQEAVLAVDVCVDSIGDGGNRDAILDKKSNGNEYNVVEDTGSSDVKSSPEFEDLGGMGDKNKPSDKETVLLPEAIEVVTVVQEEAENIDAKKADETIMVASAAQEKEIVLLPEAIQVITEVQVGAENTAAEKAAKIVKVDSAAQDTSGNTAEEKILGTGAAIEVVTVIQEGTDNTDTKKAAEIIMAASAAQDTSGNMADEKIVEERSIGAVKKMHDDGDGVKHESSKKKNHKKKSKSREDHNKPIEHTKEAGKVHMIEVKDHGKSKIVKTDHNSVKGDKITTPQAVASSVPTVEMKSVILESIVEESRSPTTTKRDEKPIRHRHVPPIVSNQAGENNQGTAGMKNKESLKEIMNEDKKAANDNDLDKQRTIHPGTKPKGTTSGNADKKRADQSGTGVHKDHPVGGGFHTSKQGHSGTHKPIPANEKRLWDQIDALRLIVGYKMARRSTLNEEMKALYVFTGVKPPTPFKNSDDIHVTEEKLHFLMSVVGVK